MELMLIKVYLREKCNKAYVSDSYLQEVAFLLVRPLLDTDKRTVKIAGRKWKQDSCFLSLKENQQPIIIWRQRLQNDAKNSYIDKLKLIETNETQTNKINKGIFFRSYSKVCLKANFLFTSYVRSFSPTFRPLWDAWKQIKIQLTCTQIVTILVERLSPGLFNSL